MTLLHDTSSLTGGGGGGGAKRERSLLRKRVGSRLQEGSGTRSTGSRFLLQTTEDLGSGRFGLLPRSEPSDLGFELRHSGSVGFAHVVRDLVEAIACPAAEFLARSRGQKEGGDPADQRTGEGAGDETGKLTHGWPPCSIIPQTSVADHNR